MKSIARYLIPSLFIIALCLLIPGQKNKNSRLDYENFLKEEYKKFSATHVGEEETERPDQPDHAYFLNHLQTLDPVTGRVPLDGVSKAINEASLLAQQSNDQASQVANTHEELVWDNIPADISGRVRAITIDPERPMINGEETTRLWAGSVTGGLWVNDNAGDPNSSWTPVEGISKNMSISSITFDPDNSDIMYLGTGESFTAINIYRESSSVGNGIWKSEDHGQTWTQLSSTTQFQYINDIVIKTEGEDNVIYSAVVSGVYKGESFQSTPSDGLFRSADGGNNWTQVLPNIPNTDTPYAPSDIELDAIGRIFVGTMRNNDLKGAGVVLHSDNGTDWTVYDEITNSVFDPANLYYPGRVIIKSAPSDPNRVYAIISGGRTEAATGWIRDDGQNSIIIQSFDQGDTWSQFALPSQIIGTWSNITWHAAAMAVNPLNPDDLLIGALNGFRLTNANLATLASGRDWSPTTFWNPPGNTKYVHADQHQIVYDIDKPDSLFVSTDGGVFFTANAQDLSPDFSEVNKNFNTLQYYSLAISPTFGDQYLMAGTQDNSTLRSINSNISFFPNSGGDGAYCFIDQDQQNLVIYSSQYNGFRVVWNRNSPSNLSSIGDRNVGLFINPSDYDSKNNILYTNRIGIDIVNNNNNSNRPILRATLGNGTIQEDILDLGVEINSPISAVKASPFSTTGRSNIFFGTQSGRLYRTLNASDTPLTREITGGDFPTSNISSIDIGRSEAEIMVTFSNYGVNSVWYTDNSGDTWQSIEGNLPDMPIRWGIFNPLDRDQIYLATELGVWFLNRSQGDGLTWVQERIGLEDIRVDMIKIRKIDGWFVAATHGRGIFQSQLNVDDFVTSTPELPLLEVQAFPNPTSNNLSIKLNANWSGETNLSLTNLQGKEFMTKSFPESSLRLDVSSLPRGIYLLKIWSNGFQSTTKRILLQ